MKTYFKLTFDYLYASLVKVLKEILYYVFFKNHNILLRTESNNTGERDVSLAISCPQRTKPRVRLVWLCLRRLAVVGPPNVTTRQRFAVSQSS